LCVEDGRADQYLLELYFDQHLQPNHLIFAADGREAINYLSRAVNSPEFEKPDLIICDLNLPFLNGNEVIRAVRTMGAYDSVPIFVLSSSKCCKEIAEVKAQRATRFFYKPDNLDQFEKVMQAIEETWLDTRHLPGSFS
jgi:CheY-like chemotaxis protein